MADKSKTTAPGNVDWHRDTEAESYNEAMNPPNNPTKNKQPTSYNVNDDYPTYGDKGNPASQG